MGPLLRPKMIALHDIRAARESFSGRIHRTPLFRTETLSRRLGTSLHLNAEFLQRTGSFKARGVLNKARQLTPAEKAAGLVSFSAGNHAAALAFAASAEGVKSTIVMPGHASPVKVQASRDYGAEIILHGTAWEAFAKMEELRSEEHTSELQSP